MRVPVDSREIAAGLVAADDVERGQVEVPAERGGLDDWRPIVDRTRRCPNQFGIHSDRPCT